MYLKIKFGWQEATKDFPAAPTVAQLKADQGLRAELGYGDNVRVLVNGTEAPDFATLSSADRITIETASNQKATRNA